MFTVLSTLLESGCNTSFIYLVYLTWCLCFTLECLVWTCILSSEKIKTHFENPPNLACFSK